METFADRLKNARLAKGMSQARLAEAVGRNLTQQAIAQMEDPKLRRQGSAHAAAIANVLDVEALWLATGRGPRNAKSRSVSQTRQIGDQTEEPMKAGLPKIVEGLCLAFTEDAVRAELSRYEERKAADKRPPETAKAS